MAIREARDLFVSLIVDKSGSMANHVNDVIGGFNSYMKSLREDTESKTMVSVTFFDTQVTRRGVLPVEHVPDLTEESYVPGGCTALFDAVVQAIGEAQTHVSALKAEPRVLVVIMTDGEENSSQEVRDQAVVRRLIEDKQKQDWAIVFLGQNMNAWAAGTALGVTGANTQCVAEDGIVMAFRQASRQSARLRRGELASADFFMGADDEEFE